jgi:hypothetical protein
MERGTQTVAAANPAFQRVPTFSGCKETMAHFLAASGQLASFSLTADS